ncbi:hypothetical protein LguiA_016413 [Lonicera macranthoides]
MKDISIVACNVRDMIFYARKKMVQDKGQESKAKNRHGPIATPSSTARAPAKEKCPAKKKAKRYFSLNEFETVLND